MYGVMAAMAPTEQSNMHKDKDSSGKKDEIDKGALSRLEVEDDCGSRVCCMMSIRLILRLYRCVCLMDP